MAGQALCYYDKQQGPGLLSAYELRREGICSRRSTRWYAVAAADCSRRGCVKVGASIHQAPLVGLPTASEINDGRLRLSGVAT